MITLDNEIYRKHKHRAEPGENPVSQQIDLLSTALGAARKG